MRNYNQIIDELNLIEKNIEDNGKTQTDFKKGEMLGEIVQLQQFADDFFELVEWIEKHKETQISKEKLIAKIKGEVIG